MEMTGTYNSPWNLFNETLGNNKELRFAMIGHTLSLIFGTEKPAVVHLKDNAQRTLLVFTLIHGQAGGRHGLEDRDSIVQVANTSGQTLLAARGEVSLSSLTVWSRGFKDYLGTLGESSFCCTRLKAVNAVGEVLFHIIDSGLCCNPLDIICCTTSSEYYLMSGGVTLALVRKSDDQAEISLLSVQNIDERTKALLVFAGYYLFISYFANTSCGRIGLRGMSMRGKRCMWIFSIMLTFTIPAVFFLWIW